MNKPKLTSADLLAMYFAKRLRPLLIAILTHVGAVQPVLRALDDEVDAGLLCLVSVARGGLRPNGDEFDHLLMLTDLKQALSGALTIVTDEIERIEKVTAQTKGKK